MTIAFITLDAVLGGLAWLAGAGLIACFVVIATSIALQRFR